MTPIRMFGAAWLARIACACAIFAGAAAADTLTVTKSGSGLGAMTSGDGTINCTFFCSHNYAPGTAIVLTATPEPGSQFTGWLGPCTGTGPCQFTISGATTAVATFAAPPLRGRTLDIDGNGECEALTDGLVALRNLFGLSGAALVNNAVAPGAPRSEAQIAGYLVDVKPALDIDGNGQADALTDGLLIIRWEFGLRGDSLVAGAIGTGATRELAADIEPHIEALCQPPPSTHALTVSKTGPGSGTVTSSPPGIDCGVDCSETYASSTVVTLTAATGAGSKFSEWNGACVGTGLCQVTMDAAKAVSANFSDHWTTSLFAGMPGIQAVADGTATTARFGAPGDMTGDGTYLWLGDGSTVRRVALATAQVVTVAGSALPAPVADDPIGLNARFGASLSLATIGSTVWIADPANGRIRAMSANAPFAVTTVAGTASGTVQDGLGTGAVLENPRGLVHFGGLLYFADASGTVLRRFDPQTTAVVTLAGMPGQNGGIDGCGPSARFESIRHAAADGTGRLFISDTNGSSIRAYDIATGCVTHAAGTGVNGYADGPIATAIVNRARGIAAEGDNLYWVEFNQHTVRHAVLGAAVATLAGIPVLGNTCNPPSNCPGGYVEGIGTAARFNLPWGLVRDPVTRSLFVYDTGNFVIRRLD